MVPHFPRTFPRLAQAALGITVAGMALPLTLGSVATVASASQSLPPIVKPNVFSPASGDNPEPIAFDSLIASTALGPRDTDVTARSNVGEVEWALASIGGFQYPVVSLNQGRNWRIGGAYFGGPWADACAFVDHLRAVQKNAVVGWGGCPGTLYVTWDSGRHWNGVPLPGGLTSLTFSRASDGAPLMTASVSPFSSTKQHPLAVQYTSNDAGRTWLLSGK
jgi:hypothetical protein